MTQHAGWYTDGLGADFVVPGTCVARGDGETRAQRNPSGRLARDRAMRGLYAAAAMAEIPRLLGAIDRNPYRATYGCLDRQFWHYRTSSFPSGMYQEGVLPLAQVFATDLPGNRWRGCARVRELAIAALRFSAKSSHPDGSCDDYYPFERALGARVFSLQAAAEAYRILELDDPELVRWFERCADWLIRHNESGRLANHQALAALGLLRVGEITGKQEYTDAAAARVGMLLAWQSGEGWFEEYGGADPGYQTLTIDCLAKIRKLMGEKILGPPLHKAVAFTRPFLHPDGSFGGEYGSRGTYHFYPHGFELLAGKDPEAADLADGFLRSLATGRQAAFADDRMFIHRLGNLIEAYVDWSPTRPGPRGGEPTEQGPTIDHFSRAGLFVRRSRAGHTVISFARGGAFKHFGGTNDAVTDAGMIVELSDGSVAVSQMHDRTRPVVLDDAKEATDVAMTVDARLHFTRFETATPIRQAVFHAGMWGVGRWCRTWVRRLLQRRLIAARRVCPVRLSRRFEFLSESPSGASRLRVTDTIELTDPKVRVRRMAFGTDHEAAYVAAAGVYQQSVLQPWFDLQSRVDELNAQRRVVVVREF